MQSERVKLKLNNKKKNDELEKNIDLFNELISEGDRKKAVEVGNKIEALLIEGLGKADDKVIKFRKTLAQLCVSIQEYEAALEILSDTLEYAIALYGEKARDTLNVYTNIGGCLIELRKYDEAKENLEIVYKEINNYKNDALYYTVLSSLAQAYEFSKKHEKANKIILEQLARLKEIGCPKTNEHLLNTRLSYARNLFKLNKNVEESNKIFNEVIEIASKEYGEDYQICKNAYKMLADQYRDLSDYEKYVEYNLKIISTCNLTNDELQELIFQNISSYMILNNFVQVEVCVQQLIMLGEKYGYCYAKEMLLEMRDLINGRLNYDEELQK